jgi:predicted Zn-dependent protease
MHANFRFLSSVIAAWLFLFTVLSADEINLPDIGDSGASTLSSAEERRVGEAVMRNIRRAGGLIDDLLLTDYLNNLGYRLVAASNSTHNEFNFYVINDSAINAFALPGGYIGAHYGLILAFDNEDELAAVIAHEIAHVTQRHHARSYEQQGNNALMTAALIAAMLLGGSGDGQLASAALASVTAGSVQKQLDYTRAHEKEADRIGISLLANAGYNPYSMAGSFEKMARESRLYGPQGPEFLRTHPVSENRIADAQSRARQFDTRPQPPDPAFYQMRARLRALTAKDPEAMVTTFKANLENGRYQNRDAEQYGYVLALLESKRVDEAARELKPLLKKDPNRIAYRLAQAEIETKRKRHDDALQIYRQALAISPRNSLLTYKYAETLLEAEKAQQARDVLEEYLREPAKYPMFYELLSRIESKLGQPANSHEAMAEYYYQIGQTQQAIGQLTVASKQTPLDFYQSSRIEAKLRQYRSEAEQLANR